MVSDKIVFNPTHNIIVRPGGGNISEPKPTHRLFLCCSHVPTEQEMGEAAERIKSLFGKLKFPFRFDPLGGGEV